MTRRLLLYNIDDDEYCNSIRALGSTVGLWFAGGCCVYMVELIEEERIRRRGSESFRPDVLAGYVQLAFDGALLSLVIAMVVKFMMVVRDDVRYKVRERVAARLRSIADCRRFYEQNGCLPGLRVPALEESCDRWFHCMNQDVEKLEQGTGSGALWARTLGEILNSFVEPISMRSAFLMLTVICAVVLVTNMAFGYYRVHHYNNSVRRGSQQ